MRLTGDQFINQPTSPSTAGLTSLLYRDEAQPYNGFQGSPYHHLEPFDNSLACGYAGYSELAEGEASIDPLVLYTPKTVRTPDVNVKRMDILEEEPGVISTASTESPLLEHTSSSPQTSSTRKSRLRKHHCTCGRSFDRATRARDCVYGHSGQTPYACKGRCKKRTW